MSSKYTLVVSNADYTFSSQLTTTDKKCAKTVTHALRAQGLSVGVLIEKSEVTNSVVMTTEDWNE